MAQTTIRVNGRSYALSCGDGEEARLEQLAAHVSKRITALQGEFGKVGDDKLMVMSLLMMADEVLDARDRVSALEKLLPTKELNKLAELAARQARELAELPAAQEEHDDSAVSSDRKAAAPVCSKKKSEAALKAGVEDKSNDTQPEGKEAALAKTG